MRVGEPLQRDGSFLEQLLRLQLLPGAKVLLTAQDPG